jgi:cytochrome c oxidase subunit IV
MSERTNHHTDEHSGEHIVPVKNYVAVFLALLVLTALTTKVAYIDLGQTAVGKTHEIDWNTVAALAIAVCKMLLVVLFFMHVKYSPKLTKLVVIAGFFWLAIMVSLTLSDVLTRGWTDTSLPWSALLPFRASFSLFALSRLLSAR